MTLSTKTTVLISLILAALFLVSCGTAAPETDQAPGQAATLAPAATPTVEAVPATPLADPSLQLATIESLEVMTAAQTGSETSVRLRGVLPNDCTAVDNIVSQQLGDEFNLVVLTRRQPGEDCSTQEVPFEEVVVLDVSGLPAGLYKVIANDSRVSFNLEAPTPPTETVVAAATPAATAAAGPDGGAVSGLVWQNACAGGDAPGAEVPEACASGAVEEGVAGVQVSLGEGECPAAAVRTATTDSAGVYRFEDLPAGTYCVFVDTADPQNQELLGDGVWTTPDSDAQQVTLTLAAGEAAQDVNFSWDFLNLLVAEGDLANCSNSFEFVADLSIADDTTFAPGTEFTKEWRLRNNGTCPWSTDYSVVFVGGDQMSAGDAYPLVRTVAPGQTLDVAVDMIAPADPGTYRGNWQIADANGEPFGIDGFIEDAFWLQIAVAADAPPAQTPQPNSGVIGGVVWDDFCVNSNPGAGCVEIPADSGVFVGDGTFGTAEVPLSDIVISLASGLCPAGGALPATGAILETAVTDVDGFYRFEGLNEGSYCVFMDALREENVDLLIPGNWTWPATGVGYYSVALDPGEQILDLDFGWDFVD
jgi:hypothetical protein